MNKNQISILLSNIENLEFNSRGLTKEYTNKHNVLFRFKRYKNGDLSLIINRGEYDITMGFSRSETIEFIDDYTTEADAVDKNTIFTPIQDILEMQLQDLANNCLWVEA